MNTAPHIINISSPVSKALAMLNDLSGKAMTLFAVDDDGRLQGSLTDGDIRRGLLRGVTVSSPVSELIHRACHSLPAGNIDLRLLKEYRLSRLRLIPLVDSEMRIVDILDTNHTTTLLPVSALLMAGGKGERLRPLTLTTPKPLLDIDGKAIIDYNVEALARAGIRHIYVATNYMAEKIEAHFKENPVGGVEIECVREPEFLGTIGAASLYEHIPADGDTLVMNSDLLTTVSFEEMYLHHRAEQADITIAAIPYNVAVPYAILTTDCNGMVTALKEKPSYSYYANAGIYIIANRLLNSLPAGERTDATDLIEQTIADGGRVSYFPLSGVWIDIGSPADFAHARELMRQHRLMGES